jgi:hypothetical protein
MKRRLEHVQYAIAEAERLGAKIELTMRSKHICGIISLNGQQRKIFLSVSPSDHRILMNVQQDVRNKVKEMRG